VAVESHLDHADWNRAAELRLGFSTSAKARAALEDELFGKRILFTDHDDWSTKEVVTSYRSQERSRRTFAR